MDLWPDELPPGRDELLKHVHGVDGLLCLLTDRIDGEVMDEAGPQLKVISNHAVGFDNIDVHAATARRIPVGNTPDVLTDATADFAFALMMAVARRIPEAERYVHEGKWKTWGPMLLLGVDMKGATLGLVGFGRIGKAMARRAAGFDMRVIYYDPKEVKSSPDIKANARGLRDPARRIRFHLAPHAADTGYASPDRHGSLLEDEAQRGAGQYIARSRR